MENDNTTVVNKLIFIVCFSKRVTVLLLTLFLHHQCWPSHGHFMDGAPFSGDKGHEVG
jgi:hypothetical protein